MFAAFAGLEILPGVGKRMKKREFSSRWKTNEGVRDEGFIFSTILILVAQLSQLLPMHKLISRLRNYLFFCDARISTKPCRTQTKNPIKRIFYSSIIDILLNLSRDETPRFFPPNPIKIPPKPGQEIDN